MSIRRGLAALLAAATLISASWGAAVSAEYGQIARQIAAAQRESFGTDTLLSRQDVLPAGQSPVADWLALALARAGIEDDYDGYLVVPAMMTIRKNPLFIRVCAIHKQTN